MSHKSLLFWEFIVNVTLSGQRNNEYYSIWSGVGGKLSGIWNWNVFTKEELLGIFGYVNLIDT